MDARLRRRDGAVPRAATYLLNFLGEESDDTIRAAFGANYARLVEVKTQVRPDNFFRVNFNLRPVTATAAR